jgi:hypothetical protein
MVQPLITTAVNNTIVQKAAVQTTCATTSCKPTVTVPSPVTTTNTMASRAAACVKAMTTPKPASPQVQPTPNKPVTSTVGAYNPTVISNVKNSLYGTGSLSDSSVHVNSIKSNINNALKVNPNDSNLLAAQKAMNSISSTSTAAAQAAALKTTQTALTSLYNQSKSSSGTKPTPIKPAPTPVVIPIKPTPVNPTPTPTPVVNPIDPKIIPINPTPTPVVTPVSGLSNSPADIESNIRNSLFGQGSFGTTALNYTKVNSNVDSALKLISKMPAANVVGNKTPNDWQQVQSSLVAAQKSMGEALSNKGIDDTAARQRGASFTAAKTELTKAEKLMNALGYKK